MTFRHRQAVLLPQAGPGAKDQDVEFRWRDYAPQAGKTGYYYVRGEQENGELVWASLFRITDMGK
jgi:hypothetical protein